MHSIGDGGTRPNPACRVRLALGEGVSPVTRFSSSNWLQHHRHRRSKEDNQVHHRLPHTDLARRAMRTAGAYLAVRAWWTLPKYTTIFACRLAILCRCLNRICLKALRLVIIMTYLHQFTGKQHWQLHGKTNHGYNTTYRDRIIMGDTSSYYMNNVVVNFTRVRWSNKHLLYKMLHVYLAPAYPTLLLTDYHTINLTLPYRILCPRRTKSRPIYPK